jgi:hypothetical protein
MLLAHCAIYRTATDPVFFGQGYHAFPISLPLADVLDLVFSQAPGSTEAYTPFTGGCAALSGAFVDQITLELGDGTKHL